MSAPRAGAPPLGGRAPTWAFAVLCAVAAVALVGCGTHHPSGSPRAAVLRLVDDLQAGRSGQACTVLDPANVPDIRQNVLSGLRAPAGSTRAQLRRYARRMLAITKRCPVALGLLARQLGSRLRVIRATAAAATLTELAPGFWSLGRDLWVVAPRHGRWVIIGADALAVDL